MRDVQLSCAALHSRPCSTDLHSWVYSCSTIKKTCELTKLHKTFLRLPHLSFFCPVDVGLGWYMLIRSPVVGGSRRSRNCSSEVVACSVSLIDIKDFAEMNEAFGCIWWIRDFYESSCLSSQLFFGLARPTKHFGLNMRNWAACHPGCLAMVQWFRGLTSGSFRQVCVEVSALAGQGKVPKTSMSIDDHS